MMFFRLLAKKWNFCLIRKCRITSRMKLILLKIELLNFRTTWIWKIVENFEFKACKELWSMLLRLFHNIIPIFWSYLGQFGSNSGSLWLALTNRWLGNTIITACSFPPLESSKRKKFRNQWLPLTVACWDDRRVPKLSGPEFGCWKRPELKKSILSFRGEMTLETN